MFVTPAGIFTVFSPLHPSNAPSGMEEMPSGNSTASSIGHIENARSPTDRRFSGNPTRLNRLHPL